MVSTVASVTSVATILRQTAVAAVVGLASVVRDLVSISAIATTVEATIWVVGWLDWNLRLRLGRWVRVGIATDNAASAWKVFR